MNKRIGGASEVDFLLELTVRCTRNGLSLDPVSPDLPYRSEKKSGVVVPIIATVYCSLSLAPHIFPYLRIFKCLDAAS